MQGHMGDFLSFTFQLLRFKQFLSRFQEENELNLEEARYIFDMWLSRFYFLSVTFYHSQYAQHQNKLSLAFKRKYKVSPNLVDDYGLRCVWEELKGRSGLDEHYENMSLEIEYARNKLRAIEQRWKQMGYGKVPRGDNKLVYLGKRIPARDVDEFWFNKLINNSQEEIAKLQNLSYEGYLDTRHWKHVRAAMLLLYRAECQEETCYTIGESYYFCGWETDIHAHHLSYENLGCERYRDLTLLCNRHHQMWHENMENFGEPRLKIVGNTE